MWDKAQPATGFKTPKGGMTKEFARNLVRVYAQEGIVTYVHATPFGYTVKDTRSVRSED